MEHWKLKAILFVLAISTTHLSVFTEISNATTTTSRETQETVERKMRLRVLSDEFKVMSYNLLNLFDAQHDEGKLDHTFLPINYPGKTINCQHLSKPYYREECLNMDWTPEKVQLKIRQIKKAIALQGSLPDVLAVQEIENHRVAKMLADELGYEGVITTDSPDHRGIDVALLYNEKKLTYIDHEERDITEALGFSSRNLLRVHFHPKGANSRTIMAFYVNHWPSQAAPPIKRVSAARALADFIDEQIAIHGSSRYHVLVMGDFNTLTTDSPNAFSDVIISPYWDNHLTDVQTYAEDGQNMMTHLMPPGTYWYGRRGVYNRLDRFFISRNLRSRSDIYIMAKTFRIVATRENTKVVTYSNRNTDYYPLKQRVPLKYNFDTTDPRELGYSDHFPIVVKFKIK